MKPNRPKRIFLEDVQAFIAAPDKVDLSEADFITDPAAADLAKYSGDLILNGLRELTKNVFKPLVSRHGKSLSLNGVKRLSKEQFTLLRDCNSEVLHLDGITSIEDYLDQRWRHGDNAIAISEFRGKELHLNGLKSISQDAAAALSKYMGVLYLNGIEEISDEVAIIFSERDRMTFLNGLRQASKKGIRFLLSNPNVVTTIRLHLDTPNVIDIHIAQNFINDPDSIDLSRATSITIEAAEELAAKGGNFPLNGITEISEDIARALAANPGALSLDGLTEISDANAAILAGYEGSYLSLGRPKLSTIALDRILLYDGLLFMNEEFRRGGKIIGKPGAFKNANTHVVDALKHGDYETITDAIIASHESDKILVRPGLYREAIVIYKQVEIVGDDCMGKVVIEAKGSNVVRSNADKGRIQNLTLRQAGGGDWFGIDISEGCLDIHNCDITSKSLSCVAIHSYANPTLRGNRIHDGNEAGVYVYENGSGILDNNDIFENKLAGVEILGGSNPTLIGNRIHSNKCNGVNVHTNGRGTLKENDIFSNGLAGVTIKQKGNPLLQGNRIHNGAAGGVFVYNNGLGTLENNEIFGNTLSGIEIKEGGSPTIRGNRIYENQKSGVYVHENGRGLIEDNDILGNSLAGISISEGGNPTLHRNRIYDGKQGGILIYENGLGILEENDIFGNALSGVEIREGGNPALRRNRIYDGRQGGVLADSSAIGTLEDNDIFRNERFGVEIRNGGNPTLRRNRIHDGKQGGVLIHKSGLGILEENDIFNNTLSGVEIREVGNPTLRDNRIYGNNEFGLSFFSESLGVIEDSKIYENAFPGILIREGANPSVRGNRIYDGKQCGIIVCANGRGLIENNEIFGNLFAGVEIREGGNPLLRGNQIYDGKSNGVYIHKNGLGTLENNLIFANTKENISIENESDPTILENLILKGKLTSIDSLSSVVARAVINQPDQEFVFENLKSLSSKAAAVLAQTTATLEFSCLDTITVEAAEALGQHKGILRLPSIKELPPGVSSMVACHRGPLEMNGIRHLSVEDAIGLSQHSGFLSLQSLRNLDPEAAQHLVLHQGVLDLSGLVNISLEVAAAFADFSFELDLSGLTEISDNAARLLAKHSGTLRLNGLTKLSDAAAEYLFQHSGPLFLDGIESLTPAARECLNERSADVSLAGLYGLQNGEDIATDDIDEIAAHAGQSFREGEEMFLPGPSEDLVIEKSNLPERKMANCSHYVTRVAGVTYENRIEAIRTLSIGDNILLRRQPDNVYDTNAIQVLTTDYRELGYIPREMAASIAEGIDFLGGVIPAEVETLQKGDPPDHHLSLSISFFLAENKTCDMNINQSVATVDTNEIVTGQIFTDKDGRFFIMQMGNTFAKVRYEDGKEKSHTDTYLKGLNGSWPQATLRTIQQIRSGLLDHGIESSDNPFFDHDQLSIKNARLNREFQISAIRSTRVTRKEIIQIKRHISRESNVTDFEFKIPPSVVSYKNEQIVTAAEELRKARVVCRWLCIMVPYLSIVGIFYVSNEFRSLSDLLGRLLLLSVLIVFLSLPLFFIVFPLIGWFYKIAWNFAKRNVVSDAMRIREDCLAYRNRIEHFLIEERRRFIDWKDSVIRPRNDYCKKLVSYLCLRVSSPWDLEIPKIMNALKSHYPEEISLGSDNIDSWQRAVWESCRKDGGEDHLRTFSKQLFKGTNIDLDL